MLGPAAAFENVVASREVQEQLVDAAQTEAYADVAQAEGYAKGKLLAADGYAAKVVNKAVPAATTAPGSMGTGEMTIGCPGEIAAKSR